MYEEELLDRESKARLALYRSKLSAFEAIEDVVIPKDLNATLRGYQKEGLNWLNFLDGFNFGGCLADDMGLGKTIQVLAFILSQRGKVEKNINLVVVPASLVFNWQQEIKKFAPTLKLKTIYGSERAKILTGFDQYEVILTSYGTLLSDIRWLKDYRFNYIFLDESQTIKNPDSQRYKAVRLLQSRNKVVMTGTPIENNTFDLYGQLSFACPGLLGNREQFKRLYSVPIDQFKDSRRAAELQKRINPFVLRRTKEQVASELPDKTEMVDLLRNGHTTA
ncbi:DEAD/DEAH box helicase [Pedobacter sp. UC225_65]|uniref:DEAD/DEAH box helicase n=1 Tax=Pedobacter sp. UC225_65 TaxID=3350173 RepID=UPI00366FF1D3